MADQNNNALVPYRPRAIQRRVDREKDHMEAKAELGKAVIANGGEIHDFASAKILEAAQFDHLMLQVAKQNLNGTYADVEETIRQLSATHRGLVSQAMVQTMASILHQAESMPVSPEAGLFARLGDGLAGLQDEWQRLQSGE